MILKSNDRVKICRKETLVIIFWHSSATSCKMATYIDVYLKGIYVGTQHFCPNQLNKKTSNLSPKNISARSAESLLVWQFMVKSYSFLGNRALVCTVWARLQIMMFNLATKTWQSAKSPPFLHSCPEC
jgi:hypothetical protein